MARWGPPAAASAAPVRTLLRPLLALTLPALLLLASLSGADPIAVLDTACSPDAQVHAYTFSDSVDLRPALDGLGQPDPTGQDFGLLDVGAVAVFDGAADCGSETEGTTGLCPQENPDCCKIGGRDYCCVALVSSTLAASDWPCGKPGEVGTVCVTVREACCDWSDPWSCPVVCPICRGDRHPEAGIGGGFLSASHHPPTVEVSGNVVAYPFLQKYPPYVIGSDGNGDGLVTDAAPDCRERVPAGVGVFTTSCAPGVDGGWWVVVQETYAAEDGRVDLDNPLQSRPPFSLQGAPAGFIRTG